jgi:membrane protease YdiL (CAAX protease family)
MMMGFNLCISGILTGVEALLGNGITENLNNEAIMDLARTDSRAITAMAVFLAPLTEEMLFRGAIFGGIRKKNRIAAYAVSMLLFSIYHTWGYAIDDPSYWLYTIQYLPAAYLLCRCYERTNSIWCSIFFHMLVNHISMRMLTILEELL